VRNAPEKLFVMNFPHLMPPTLISRDLDEINSFRDEHGAVVMKPLHGHGGAAVFRVMPQDMNFGSLFDMFSVTFREPWVIQRFLPEVKHGDKRIILVDGEFAGAVGPALRERGLLFVGIDVIDGNLTEINVTSPTGIRAIQRLNGPDVAAMVWDSIEKKRAGK
jgi:glutathione synthase